MTPEEFKIQNLIQQIGTMAQTHAIELAETHLKHVITVQSLEAQIAELRQAAEPQPEAEEPQPEESEL